MNKIMVVEDDRDMLEIVCDFLKNEGYETIKAANGKIGLEMAMKYNPDLILSDVMMPEMDGFTFLEKIREAPLTRLTPFIILSVKDKEDEVLKGLRLGAQDYVTKPFNFDVLHERIKRQLELLNYRHQLEAEKKEYLITVVKKNKHLELKNRLIKRITHDINNPLTVVKGKAELLLNKLSILNLHEEKERLVRDPVEKIINSTDRISDMLQLLLKDFQNENEKKILKLETLAGEVIKNNHDNAKIKHQEIDLRIQKDLFVKGYKDDLMSAMDNLISNAIKFSPEKKPIRVSLEKDTDFVYYRVQDEGPGLTEEQKEKYRTDPANVGNKPVGGGVTNGIGATIVMAVIGDHNGELIIDSNPGYGATFIMKLPAAG